MPKTNNLAIEGQNMKYSHYSAKLAAVSALVFSFGFSSVFAQTATDDDDEMEEVVVYGSRSATQNSLAKQKAKDNISTVLSADLSGRFADSTLAETMRRAPGLSFQRSEAGGEGQYVSIRGLDTGLNNIKINGVTSAAASGSRRVSFDFLQAEMLSEIVVNKSLLPQHDGEGIGGAVELNVRNPLSFSKDQLNFKVEARHGEYRGKTGPAGSVVFNRALSDNVAISGYVSYTERFVDSHQYNIEGDHLPRRIGFFEDAADPGDLMDRAPGSGGGEWQNGWARIYGPLYTADDFPGGFDDFVIEDFKYNFSRYDKNDRSATFNVGWRPTDDTEVVLALTAADSYRSNLRQAFAFYQSDKYVVPSGCFVSLEALDTDYDCGGALYDGSIQGTFYGQSPQINIKGEALDYERDNKSATVRITTDLSDTFRMIYGFGYTKAELNYHEEDDLNYRIDDLEKETPSDFGGVPLTTTRSEREDGNDYYIAFDESGGCCNIPIPLLSDAGWAAVTDPNMPEFYYGSFGAGWKEGNERYVVYSDMHKLFPDGGMLTDVKFGFKVERSDFFDWAPHIGGSNGYWEGCCQPDGTWGHEDASRTRVSGEAIGGLPDSGKHRLSESNLVDGLISLRKTDIPIPGMTHMLNFSRKGIRDFGRKFRETYDYNETGFSTLFTQEDIFGIYFQVGLDLTEDLHVIAGLRYEQVDADVGYLYLNVDPDLVALGAPEDHNSSATGGYTDVLPRLQLSYRPTENIVIRGAFSSSVARPVLRDMGINYVSMSEERDEEGIATGETSLNVRLANPDLETAYAYNADLMAEYYTDNGGIFGFGVFFKRIDNFIYRYTAANAGVPGSMAEVQGFENLDISGFDQINYNKQQNGEKADIRGIELNVIYSFEDMLPGFWSGFGVYANLTLQRSDANIVASTYPYLVQRKVDFHNSPRTVGNFALTYEKHGIDATVSYAYQDWQMDTVEDFMNQDEWEAPYYSVDVNIQYTLPWNFAGGSHLLFFKLSDVTNTDGSRAINQETHGRNTRWLDDAELIGRQFRFGFRSRF